jgi:hypothetical protein
MGRSYQSAKTKGQPRASGIGGNMETPKLQNKEMFGGKPMVNQAPLSKADAEHAKKKLQLALEKETDPAKQAELREELDKLTAGLIAEDKSL